MIIVMWWACGAGPTAPAGPDPRASDVAAENLCKLFRGAQLACAREGTSLQTDAGALAVTARFDTLDERLGITTFRGSVTVEDGPRVWSTRMGGFGSGREEALERGLHEWALVDGLALVDALRADPTQAALRSIEPTAADTGLVVGDRPVFRGWTLQRPALEQGVDHTELVRRLEPVVVGFDAGPHAIRIEVSRANGPLTVGCSVDGAAPAPCPALDGVPWPEVPGYELRQTYMVRPK